MLASHAAASRRSMKGDLVEQTFKLIPEAVPSVARATVYVDAMREFSKSKIASVRVEIPGKKPSTVHQGLLKAKRLNPELASVRVMRRADDVYLSR
jgi:hypothetical protein